MAIVTEFKMPDGLQLPTTVLNTEGRNINTAPTVVKITVLATDFTAAATVEDIEIFTLPIRAQIINSIIKHTTAFSGGTLSAANLSVGFTGVLDAIIGDFDVFQAVGDTLFSAGTNAGGLNFGATQSIRCEGEATGDNWDNVSTGAADIYLTYMVLP